MCRCEEVSSCCRLSVWDVTLPSSSSDDLPQKPQSVKSVPPVVKCHHFPFFFSLHFLSFINLLLLLHLRQIALVTTRPRPASALVLMWCPPFGRIRCHTPTLFGSPGPLGSSHFSARPPALSFYRTHTHFSRSVSSLPLYISFFSFTFFCKLLLCFLLSSFFLFFAYLLSSSSSLTSATGDQACTPHIQTHTYKHKRKNPIWDTPLLYRSHSHIVHLESRKEGDLRGERRIT